MCDKCKLAECACNNPYFQLMLALSGGLSRTETTKVTFLNGHSFKECARPKGLADLPPLYVIGTCGTDYDWETN